MPRYTRRSTGSHRGGSKIMTWLKTKALPFIRKHQLVSKGLKFAGKTFNKPVMNTLGAAAGQLGYGRRCRGGALRMAGGSRCYGGALRM